VQSAQPAQTGGAAETNHKHELALLLTLLLLFAQPAQVGGAAETNQKDAAIYASFDFAAALCSMQNALRGLAT